MVWATFVRKHLLQNWDGDSSPSPAWRKDLTCHNTLEDPSPFLSGQPEILRNKKNLVSFTAARIKTMIFLQVRNRFKRGPTPNTVRIFLSMTAWAVIPYPCSCSPLSYLAATSGLLCGHLGWSPSGGNMTASLGTSHLLQHELCLRTEQERQSNLPHHQAQSPGAGVRQPLWRSCCAKRASKWQKEKPKWARNQHACWTHMAALGFAWSFPIRCFLPTKINVLK